MRPGMRAIGRALPRSAELKPAERGGLAAAFVLVGALLVLVAANALLGVGGGTAGPFIRDVVGSVVYVLVAGVAWLRPLLIRTRRRAFTLIAAGVTSYALGNVLWATWLAHLAHPPVPSVCDLLWLAFYPLVALGIVGL